MTLKTVIPLEKHLNPISNHLVFVLEWLKPQPWQRCGWGCSCRGCGRGRGSCCCRCCRDGLSVEENVEGIRCGCLAVVVRYRWIKSNEKIRDVRTQGSLNNCRGDLEICTAHRILLFCKQTAENGELCVFGSLERSRTKCSLSCVPCFISYYFFRFQEWSE